MGTQESTPVEGSYRQTTTGGTDRLVDALADIEQHLWGILFVALVADVALTGYGLQHGLQEGNPAMRLAIETAGLVALLGAKLAVVGVGAVVRWCLDERGAIVPLGLALPWFVAAVINAAHLL